MYLIDTNIHAAFLLQNYEKDPGTKKYLEAYDKILLKERVITDFILAELEIFIMQVVPARYRLTLEDTQALRRLAHDYLRTISKEYTLLGTDIATIHSAQDIYNECMKEHYISFFDSLILATAKEKKLMIFSRDKRLCSVAMEHAIECFQPLT